MGNEIITINIDGGCGRNIAATGVVEQFAKDNPDKKINVICSHEEVFFNNDHINKVYRLDHPYLFEDHIQGTEYLTPEPYKEKDYYDDGVHLINSFNKLKSNL